jgi:hypothetical protein
LAGEGEKREGGEAADGAEHSLKEVEGASGKCGETAIGAKSLAKEHAEPDDTGDGDHLVEDVDTEKPWPGGDAKKGGGGVAGNTEAHLENEAASERGKELKEEGEAEDASDGLRSVHAEVPFCAWREWCYLKASVHAISRCKTSTPCWEGRHGWLWPVSCKAIRKPKLQGSTLGTE